MDYTFDPAAAAAVPALLKASSVNIRSVDISTGSFSVTTGAANATDPATGQTLSITNILGGVAALFSIATGSVASQSTLGGLPAAVLSNVGTASASGYVLPYSATLNPAGYRYQTFGVWSVLSPIGAVMSESYFSAGVMPGAVPVAGTASYTGKAAGSGVDAATRDPYDISATMNATANFSTRSVAFRTTGTTSLSNNAVLGTLPSANSGLDISGTLNYAAGSNTFTGLVATVNGMTGNATGRFYGPGIVSNQVMSFPPEIGGTFAVMNPLGGAMHGAFGGSATISPTLITIPTVITGPVTPPVTLTAGLTNGVNMLTPVNSVNIERGIVQSTDYTLEPTAYAALPSIQKVTSVNFNSIIPVVDTGASLTISTGATAYLADPTIGIASSLSLGVGGWAYQTSTAGGAVVSQSTLAGLPSARFADSVQGYTVDYVLPYSATLSPTGYTYQTFGSWSQKIMAVGVVNRENYFSAGVSTVAGTLPVLGTATYTGQAAGTYVNAVTNDPSQTTATMNATANFAARTVAFSTTGTTSLSNNAVAGTLPTANAALNMSGTLSYAVGNNTFTGAVSTTNGMSGNATGRFYGPGIVAATPTKAIGAPPEIGGTFAVMAAGVGAMQGAFGGK
jgi:hypothetical protein